jgi:hypothetical protein
MTSTLFLQRQWLRLLTPRVLATYSPLDSFAV